MLIDLLNLYFVYLIYLEKKRMVEVFD